MVPSTFMISVMKESDYEWVSVQLIQLYLVEGLGKAHKILSRILAI